MKKSKTLITLAAAAALTTSANAALNGTGYYRITNNYTDRYIYVTDNTGDLNMSTTSADMGAIELWLGIERTLYDPATVLYCQQISGNKYDIQAQGTGIYQMIGFYVTLMTDPRVPGTYMAYGSAHGMTKYLYDGISSTARDKSFLSDVGKNECRYWKINPIDASTENYFGVKPTVATAGGEHYASFYASFPFTFASSGMKACYITKMDSERGYAVYKEITGTVPGATPLFIKCNSADHSDNRLNIGGTATAPGDNIGVGVYFNNDKGGHVNRVAYNPQTMRVLGTMSDGTLAMVTESYDYMPRNTFYVNVPAGAPAQYTLVSESEYADIIANTPVDATGITLSQTALTLTMGETATLTANVLPAEATNRSVTWTSSNTAVASVDPNGKVTTTGVGTATITATTHNGFSATCQVTVNPVMPASVTISQTQLSLVMGESVTLTATVLPENAADKSIRWYSDNSNVAAVSAEGVVTARREGTANISAVAVNGVKAICQVTVTSIAETSITLDKPALAINVGQTARLNATILPANASYKDITWTTDNSAVATVDAYGNVTGKGAGTAKVTATSHNGLKAECTVTVSIVEAESVQVLPDYTSVYPGMTRQLLAWVLPDNTTNKNVTWTSSDTEKVRVDANGIATGVAVGEAMITATTHNGLQSSCRVVVLPKPATDVILSATELTLKVDEQSTIVATVLPEDTTDPTVRFSSTNPSVASVTDAGVVTAHHPGTAVIEVRCNLVKSTCEVTVVKKNQTITWEQEFTEVHEGDRITLTARASSGLEVRYETSDNATVEGNVLTVLTPGEVRVKALQDGDEHHEAAEPVEISFNALAGISDAVYDAVTVQAEGADIVVAGKPADAEVRVYTLTGMPVYTGTESRISLQRNTVYIVVIGSHSFKIATK